MSSGPSGRSPFPGRGRRRLSAELAADAATNNAASDAAAAASFASPNISNLLSQSRLSPAAASGWSPMNQNSTSRNNNNNNRPRRFFESVERSKPPSSSNNNNNTDGGVLATGIPFAQMGAATKHTSSLDDDDDDDDDNIIDGINVTRIRALAQNAQLSTATLEIAVFYASILHAKTGSSQDAHLHAQTLAANGQAMRSVRVLERAGLLHVAEQHLDELHLESILLAAHCLATMDEWAEALALLESATQQGSLSILEDDDDVGWQELVQSLACQDALKIHPVARLCVLRGRAYHETSNPTRAAVYWKRALRVDAKCVQALDLLLESNMVTPHEAHELIMSLEMEEMTWLHDYYLARVSVSAADTPPSEPCFASLEDASSIQMATPSVVMMEEKDENHPEKMPPKTSISQNVATAFDKLWTTHKLDKAPETLALAANRAYRQYDLTSALEYCKELTALDPLCPTASFVYVATLLALDHKRLLFQLAHEWVQACPKSAHSWFAVGSYYYACGRFHVAQRHYCRATRLDPQCTEAWIAFGCSFAMSDETDQALASFRAAQRLAPAHNVPLLYMGMEYLRTNHLVLARHFLMAANKTSHGGDPLCLHELGVADYQRKEFATAAVWFQRALMASGGKWEEGSSSSRSSTNHDPVELCQDVFWEPTLFNLGQCYRKSRQFGEAKRCFEKCLSLCPVSFVSCVHVYIVTDMIVYVYTHGFRFRLTISTTGERVLLFCTGIHQALVWGHRRCH